MPKISSFADGSPLVDSDEFLVARGVGNNKIPASSVKSYVGSSSPLTIPSGLTPILWLSVQNISGLVDGNSVLSWPDLSASANTATAPIGTAPLYKTNVFGIYPAVRFNGATSFMTLTATATLSAYATVIFCGKLTAPAQKSLVAGNSAANIQFALTATDEISTFDTATTLTSLPFQIASTSFRMCTFRHSYSRWDFFEGSIRPRVPTVNSSGLSTSIDQIGKSNYAGDFFFGDMAEIVAYQKDLGESDLHGIFEYFAASYSGNLFA